MSLPIEVLLGHLIIACVSLVFYEIQNELEQIFHGGGPNWLEQDENINQQQQIPEENPAEEVRCLFYYNLLCIFYNQYCL